MPSKYHSATQNFVTRACHLFKEKLGSNNDGYALALLFLAKAKRFKTEKPDCADIFEQNPNASTVLELSSTNSVQSGSYSFSLETLQYRFDTLKKHEPQLASDLAQQAMACVPRNSYFLIEDLLPLSNTEVKTPAIPQRLVSFMGELLEAEAGFKVYAPWDVFVQFSNEFASINAAIDVVTPLENGISFLINFLTRPQLQNDRLTSSGKQNFENIRNSERYKASIACAPNGELHDYLFSQHASSNRFPEETQNLTILALQHLQLKTQGRIVLLVPFSFLFASGAEKEARKKLLSKGQLRAVVGLPQNFLAAKSPSAAILLLDQHVNTKTVLFAKIGDIRPYQSGSEKTKASNFDKQQAIEIVYSMNNKTVDEQLPSKYKRIDVEHLLLDSANLSVDRQFSRATQTITNRNRATRTIGSIFEIIRPPRYPSTKIDLQTTESIEEIWEITAADLPEYAFIKQASRQTIIAKGTRKKFSDSFVQENDIVLIHKGAVGKVGMIHGKSKIDNNGWLVGQSSLILRAQGKRETATAVFMFLRSLRGQDLLRSIVSGSATPFFTLLDLVSLSIPDFSHVDILNAMDAFERECQIQEKLISLSDEQAKVAQNLWGQI
jgi:type I restriction enzyme M protein